MRAVLIKDGKGPAENLYIGEAPTPEPKAEEVQVKIQAFGLNRMDLLQREGNYPLPPQASKEILGVEFAGTVSKLGDGANKFKVGDEVFGLAYGGAYAEYICNPEFMTVLKPKELSMVEAAAIPECFLTAYQALFIEGHFSKGQNALIHAGASGVGVAAIQLALHVGQADKVFATCGSDEKVKFLDGLNSSGKVHAFNYKIQDFEEEIKKIDDGVDQIVDFIGPDYFQRNLNLLRRDGLMIFLAALSGGTMPQGIAFWRAMQSKRLTLKGSGLRSRSPEYQKHLLQQFEERAMPLILKKQISVEIHEVFPWTKVSEAHNEMAENRNSGKIVFEVTA